MCVCVCVCVTQVEFIYEPPQQGTAMNLTLERYVCEWLAVHGHPVLTPMSSIECA